MSGRSVFWGPLRQTEDRAQLAANLDPENATLRDQADLLDQAANQLTRIGGIVGGQRLRELGDPPAV
ncbi:hypothetical protein [Roseococcus sp.]|uniref:hypothetical protein n=1 Tax=Roseococcus sp. TaxID=2109646 RepID=UPI003BA8942B